MSDSSANSVSTDHWSDAGTGTTFALNLSRGANEVSVPAALTETLITVREREREKNKIKTSFASVHLRQPPALFHPSTFRRCSAPPVHSLANKTTGTNKDSFRLTFSLSFFFFFFLLTVAPALLPPLNWLEIKTSCFVSLLRASREAEVVLSPSCCFLNLREAPGLPRVLENLS